MTASGSSVADVARIVRPSRKQLYSNYIAPAIPVVITPEKGGLLTPERLRRRFADTPIPVGIAQGRTLLPNPKTRELPFDDYAAYVESTPDGDLEYAYQIPYDSASAGTIAPLLPDAAL